MSEISEKVNFTRSTLRRFKQAYEQQVAAGKNEHATFVFDGREWVIGYAKYAIEYLEMQFGKD